MPARIAVLGSGVIGLTCADVLRRNFDVTIFTKERMARTSRAAVAIWFPHSIHGPRVERWALATRTKLDALMARHSDAGIRLVDFTFLKRTTSVGFSIAESMRVHLIDTTKYLPFLWSRAGDLDVRETTLTPEALEDVAREFALIVNCTGYESQRLWPDPRLKPGCGVVVRVPRPHFDGAFVCAEDLTQLMYVVPRIDDCILGGVEEEIERWETNDEEVNAIVARCVAAVRDIVPTELERLVGVRPMRDEVRFEASSVHGRPLIHNYGHGGGGFTVSWGCAEDVAALARQMIV